MLDSVEVGAFYQSKSGYVFKVIGLAKHGQDCSLAMVCYESVTPTTDSLPGQLWVICETIFLKRFSLYDYNG